MWLLQRREQGEMVKVLKNPRGLGGYLNILEKGETANPKGRPRKIATTLKHEGYSQWQIEKTFEMLSALSIDELEKFAKNPNVTVLEAGICKMIRKFFKDGKSEVLDYLIAKKVKSEITMKEEREPKTLDEVKEALKERGLPSSLYNDDIKQC